MPVSKNTYKGMNQDMSKTMHSPEFYYEGKDIRVVTEEGLSTGDVENERGNEFVFSIPTTVTLIGTSVPTGATIAIGALSILTPTGNVFNATPFTEPGSGTIQEFFAAFKTFITTDPNFIAIGLEAFLTIDGIILYSQTTDILSISDPLNRYDDFADSSRIIGEGKIRQDIFLFSTASPTYAAANRSYIWKFLYTQSETDVFTPSVSLVYGGPLGLSEEYPIGDEVEGRYESPDIQKIFWADGKHNVRFINTAADNQLLDPNSIESSPKIDAQEVSIDAVDGGGSLVSGLVQYAYQAANTQGGITSLSPLSIPVHLTESSESSTTNDYFGQPAGDDSGKSVSISISGISEEFTVVQFYRIHYKDRINTPTIDIVSQTELANGTASFTDTGSATLGGVTLAEFLSLINLNVIPQTIAVKDDRLFQGNLEEPSFDIDFDARAYRYNSSLTIQPANPDDINPYNANFNDAMPAVDKYIYKADGTTVGGQGTNVSYSIERVQARLDNDNYSGYNGTSTPQDSQRRLGVTNTGNVFLHPDNPYKDNYASPIISGDRRGYKRGEVYRFGLKFVAKTGNSSFVKWIGDIKMPTCSDTHHTVGHSYATSERANVGGDVLGNIIYPKFEVNLSTLSPAELELIDYVEIVRVERTENDKTILGQGVVANTVGFNDGTQTIPKVHPFTPSLDDIQDNYADLQCAGGASSNPSADIIEFISPEFLLTDKINFKDGDLLRYQTVMTDWTRNVGTFIGSATPTYTERRNEAQLFTGDNNQVIVSKGRYADLRIDETSATIQTEIEEFTPAIASKGLTNTLGAEAIENSVSFEVGEVVPVTLGIDARGNSKLLMKLAKPNITLPDLAWVGFVPDRGSVAQPNDDGYIIADYKRPRAAQYGGATVEARSINTYITTGERIAVTGGGTKTLHTFGGDTFIAYFDYLRLSPNDVPGSTKRYYQEVLFVPLETSINLELRHDRAFHNLAKNKNDNYIALQESLEFSQAQPVLGTTVDGEATDLYLYNETYDRENEVIPSFPEPLVANLSTVFDTRTRYSNIKIDSETFDSWTQFLTDNVDNVDNKYGPITKLLSFKDELMFIQETGFGQWQVNPRVQTTASDGQPIELGVGGVLHDYNYISTKFGTNQKFGIIPSEQNMYFLDPRTNKLIKTGQGSGSISDILGMYSYFRNNLNKELRDSDNPFIGAGITASYDRKLNEVLFTVKQTDNDYTIGFNELTNTFTEFYRYTPSIYVEHSQNIFSFAPNNRGMYVHHFGDRGVYYDQAPVESEVTIIINPEADMTKVFNNIELYSQVFDAAGNEIFDETVSAVRFYNDYQDSGKITLTNKVNLRRRMRKWRMNVFRDNKARMRNPYLFVTLYFQNNNNKRLVLHHLLTYFDIRPNN